MRRTTKMVSVLTLAVIALVGAGCSSSDSAAKPDLKDFCSIRTMNLGTVGDGSLDASKAQFAKATAKFDALAVSPPPAVRSDVGTVKRWFDSTNAKIQAVTTPEAAAAAIELDPTVQSSLTRLGTFADKNCKDTGS
jgi:hypothetical protein